MLLTGTIWLAIETIQSRGALAASCSAGTISRISSRDSTNPSLPGIFYVDDGVSPSPTGMYVGYTITNNSGTNYSDLWVKLENFTGGIINLATYEDGIVHVGPLANGASTTVYIYLNATGAPSSGNSAAQSHTVSLYPTRPNLAVGAICGDPFLLVTEQTIKASANKINTVVSGPIPAALGGIVTETIIGDTGVIGSAGIFAFTPASDPNWPANAYQLVSTKIVLSGGNTGTYNNTLYLSGLNSKDTSYTITYTYVAVGTTTTPTKISPVKYLSSGTQIKHNDTSVNASLPALQPTANTITFSSKTTSPTALPTGGTVDYTVVLTNTSTNSSVVLDDIVDTLPSTPGIAKYVAGTAKFNGVAIPDPKISGQTLTFSQLFAVSNTGTLTYQATIPNIAGTYTNQVVGHVGSTQIDATLITTDNVPATADVSVGLLPSSITGTVFIDNGDLAFGTGDTGLSGRTINLLNSTGDIIATTTTMANGSYVLPTNGLVSGNQYIVQVESIGLQQVVDPDSVLNSQNTFTYNLSSVSNLNFGYVLPTFSSGNIARCNPGNTGNGYVYVATAKSVYRVNVDTGAAVLIFTDSSLTTGINSLAFDESKGIIYYTDTTVAGSNVSVKKYDLTAGGAPTIAIADVTTLGVMISSASGIGGGGATMYNGSLYLGVEDIGTGAVKPDQLWRIDFDSSGSAIAATMVYSNTTAKHDWGDLVIANGVVYDFSNGGTVTEINLSTGNVIVNTIAGTAQAAATWNNKIWNVSTTIRQYSGGALTGPTTTINGGGWTGSASDATSCAWPPPFAQVLLVKRITAINGNRNKNPNDNILLNAFVDDTTAPHASDDNNNKWPASYLLGAINAGKIKPGDELEYTIYFLNAGLGSASNVRICDRLLPNQTFKVGGYGVGKDIELQLGNSALQYLTSANDAADRTQLFSAGAAVPSNCNLTGANTNGTLLLDLTGAASTGNPTITTMPGATGPETPNNSYGFFRFRTTVNP
jgi:uncharacterized repeat protein (TIGR01451 family)